MIKRRELEEILESDFGYMSIDRQTEILSVGSLEPVNRQKRFLTRLSRTKGIENALEMLKGTYTIGESEFSEKDYRTLEVGDVDVFQTASKIDSGLYQAIVKTLQEELRIKPQFCGKKEIEPVLALVQTNEPTKTYQPKIIKAIKAYAGDLSMPPTEYRNFTMNDVEKIRMYIK